MPLTCSNCGKEAKNAAGLAAHQRSHAAAAPAAPAAEVTPVASVASAIAEENFVEKAREGEFALAVCGDFAVLTDLTGKRVSRPMALDEARRLFQRMATARR